jgi:hypothetical protein
MKDADMKKSTLIILIYLMFPANVFSEVIFDGTIHPSTQGMTLQGDIEVKADQGKISAHNLYHSFSRFNINENETATFTGPEHIENIISRVTGMEQSIIDGALVSEIPDANFYFPLIPKSIDANVQIEIALSILSKPTQVVYSVS